MLLAYKKHSNCFLQLDVYENAKWSSRTSRDGTKRPGWRKKSSLLAELRVLELFKDEILQANSERLNEQNNNFDDIRESVGSNASKQNSDTLANKRKREVNFLFLQQTILKRRHRSDLIESVDQQCSFFIGFIYGTHRFRIKLVVAA